MGALEPVTSCNIEGNPAKKRCIRKYDENRLQSVYTLVQNFTKNNLEEQTDKMQNHLIEVGSLRRDFFKKHKVTFYEDAAHSDINLSDSEQ